MAEDYAKSTQYAYTTNASLVIQTDRRHLPRRDQQGSASGLDVETLHGKIDPHEMGTRVVREKPPVLEAVTDRPASKKKSTLSGKSTLKKDIIVGKLLKEN